jgi:hypothetical protein
MPKKVRTGWRAELSSAKKRECPRVLPLLIVCAEKGLAEEVGRWKDGLPVFTAEEVAKHKTKSTG